MDPFVVMHAIPAEPRAWFLGSGPSTFTTRWRERLIHRLGGLLPVWRGGVGVDQHVASARAVIANDAVFAQMPEGTVSGPPGTGRAIPGRLGSDRLAGGRTDRAARDRRNRGVYLGRRLASRVLPATSVRALAGLEPGAALPDPGSREELALAHRMSDALAAILGPAANTQSCCKNVPWFYFRTFMVGVPYLFFQPSTSKTGATSASGIGNPYLGLKYSAKVSALDFSTRLNRRGCTLSAGNDRAV